MSISDILGYNNARNLSKIILLVSALAVSTIALSGSVLQWLNFEFFMPVRNYIAILAIVMIFMVKEDIPTPYFIHYSNTQITRWLNYILWGIIALDISSMQFFLTPLLSYPILGYALLALRNAIAIALLIHTKIIHDSG